MRVVRGTFATNAGSAIYLGIGFVPKQIRIWNLTDATNLYQVLDWAEPMRTTAKNFDGFYLSSTADPETAGTASDLTTGGGVAPYLGGDIGNATLSYQIADPHMNKIDKGATGCITKWTLGNTTNKTGNFDKELWITAPDPCGVGSMVIIDGKKYWITSLTSNGEAANETTLNAAAPSGVCSYVGGIYTHIACPATMTMPAGVYIAETTDMIPTTEACYFEAYDE